MESKSFDTLLPRKPSDNQSLTEQLAVTLRKIVLDNALEPGSRLPNEPELAERLNVSRSTLRAALQTLERDGLIIRRRGIGTFVADKASRINNLNLNWGVTQVIESMGAKPGTLELLVVERPASHHVAMRLNIEEGSPMILVERVRTTDERRVVFTVDHIPCKLLEKSDRKISREDIEEYFKQHDSMYVYLREILELKIHHAIAWISPLSADKFVADKLQIGIGSEMLYIEQVDYSSEDEPYVLADEYHVANAFSFTVYRSN